MPLYLGKKKDKMEKKKIIVCNSVECVFELISLNEIPISSRLRETTPERRNRTTKSRKTQNARRKGNLQIHRDIGS